MAMFTGCQNEEIMEQDSEKDESVPTGDTRIIIEGEGMLETSARSSDGRGVQGGTLEFQMGPNPNPNWGASTLSLPPETMK